MTGARAEAVLRGVGMKNLLSSLLLLAVALPAGAATDQDTYRDGRVRYLEPGVVLQRATETGAEEAQVNVPFLPGDRVWTDAAGRAEFQFGDGSLLRLDVRSKLDFIALEPGSEVDTCVLRLWSGSLELRSADAWSPSAYQVETPGGLVYLDQRGTYRVDVDLGETRLLVLEGEAVLEGQDRRVRVEAGEASDVLRGEPPARPQRFDRYDKDDFALWNEDRDAQVAWAGEGSRYLPEDLAPYASELDAHGSWYYEAEVGYVWRPYVGPEWRPYFGGHWIWTAYGWTWIPNDPWGWAPFHYGRWGYSGAVGWYWIPGSVWGPAWVSWAVGPSYVGWCPLGYRDRPLNVSGILRGHAVPRGSVTSEAGWLYARRSDFGARHAVSRYLTADKLRGASPQVVTASRSLDRQFRVRDTRRAVPRVDTRPGPGDTVPELRHDPFTMIPIPQARRRDGERPRWEQDRSQAPSRDLATPRPVGHQRLSAPSDDATTGGATERPSSRRLTPNDDRPSAGPAARPTPDEGRDVLRRFFSPLVRTRDEAGSRDRAAPREGSWSGQNRDRSNDASSRRVAPRSQPQRVAPRPKPQRVAPQRPPRASPSPGGHARTRDRDKQHNH